jgi:hypothetical protein
MAIISDQRIPWRARVNNLAEMVGRCNVFFVTHVLALHSKESLDPIIIFKRNTPQLAARGCAAAVSLAILEGGPEWELMLCAMISSAHSSS